MGIFKRNAKKSASPLVPDTGSKGPFFCGAEGGDACVTVCARTAPGICHCGCEEVRQALEEQIRSSELNVRVAAMKVGCNGTCPYGPLLGFPGGGFCYHRLTPERAREAIVETIAKGHILFDLLHLNPLQSTSGRLLYDHASEFIAVLDESRCMVQVAKYFLDFDQGVSCGKCTPCRTGFVYLRELIDAIAGGEGRPEDLPTMHAILTAMRQAAYCEYAGRGSGPLAVILRHFRPEFEMHINQRLCPVGECPRLSKRQNAGGTS